MSLNVGDLIPIGGTGNAQPADVLVGKTFTNDDGPDKVGTMPNNGPSTAETINLTSQNQEYTVAQGYHSGLRKIKAVISGLVASVIKAGTTVGGIVGTFTSDATASAGHILSGMTAYVNGNKITGSIPSKGAATYTPGTTDQTIAAGQYLSGAQTIKGDTNLIASNIKSGVQIFGVTGTHVVTFAPGNQVTARHTYDDSTGYTTPRKVAQFKIPVAGTYRVSFNLGAGTNGYNAYGRIYKNGAAYGTLRIVTTYTKVTFTEDLTFNAGDTCELWIYTSNSVVYAYANEFMLLTGIATPYILDVT